MAEKENKGGLLSNEQVEQDLAVKQNAAGNTETYRGSQDNGDTTVRHLGNDVQRADGQPASEESGE